MQSLQHAGGAYCLVTTHKDHDVRASLRGFTEGDNLRVLRAKDEKVGVAHVPDATQTEKLGASIPRLCIENDMGCTVRSCYGHVKSKYMLARNSF